MKVSVILGRNELMTRYTEDLQKAKNKVNLIVIGLPIGIPAETLFEEVAAVKRGVVFRELVQEVTPTNKEMHAIPTTIILIIFKIVLTPERACNGV